MMNPFEHEKDAFACGKDTFTSVVRDAVKGLAVGEAAPFNLGDLPRAKLSGTLSNYSIKGRFRTKKDPSTDGVVWIQRTE